MNGHRDVASSLTRDGARWRLGTASDVAWIAAGTEVGTAITSGVPPVFEAYATLVLPEDGEGQDAHDSALLAALQSHSRSPSWWLGYLDTGADDVVFPDAPRTLLYAEWPYVLVLAGPAQAATWRRGDFGSFWSGHLPNLIFPADHGWLVSTLWDDDWTCIGGPAALVDDLLRDPVLGAGTRRVELGPDATPPGHEAR